MLYGGRISLVVGVAVAIISIAFGALVGVIAGFYGRWIDNPLMRVTDLFLAIPLIVILIIGSELPATQGWAQAMMGRRQEHAGGTRSSPCSSGCRLYGSSAVWCCR